VGAELPKLELYKNTTERFAPRCDGNSLCENGVNAFTDRYTNKFVPSIGGLKKLVSCTAIQGRVNALLNMWCGNLFFTLYDVYVLLICLGVFMLFGEYLKKIVPPPRVTDGENGTGVGDSDSPTAATAVDYNGKSKDQENIEMQQQPHYAPPSYVDSSGAGVAPSGYGSSSEI
jgi:hypothetical protein